VQKYFFKMTHSGRIFSTLDVILIQQVRPAQLNAGDISRSKKVKEKRPSPFLFLLSANRNKDSASYKRILAA
jgi:hypothetical protein